MNNELLNKTNNTEYLDIPLFIADILSFFNQNGFEVSSDIQIKFFQCMDSIQPTSINEIHDILQMLICKQDTDIKNFNSIFYTFFNNHYNEEGNSFSTKIKKEKKEYKKAVHDKQEAELFLQQTSIENYKEKETIANKNLQTFEESAKPEIDKKEQDSILKENHKLLKDMKASLKNTKNEKEALMVLNGNIDTMSDIQIELAKNSFNESLKNAITSKNSILLMKFISKEMNFLNSIVIKNKYYEENHNEKLKEYMKAQMKRIEVEKNITKAIQKINENNKIIKKYNSVAHRQDFFSSGNSVQIINQTAELGDISQKDIKLLSNDEKAIIHEYIKKNSKKFYTILKRKMHSPYKKEIDMPETIKSACKTGGIPIKLCYKKPKKSKPNVILILDISGSCKSASELMLTYMYYMKKVFKGGCKAFAFVGHMYDITNVINDFDVDNTIKNVFKNIPTKGVYSNYSLAFKDFDFNFGHYVNKDTIFIFIGDARNNKNQSEKEILYKYTKKAKASYWLNTEKKEMWNTNDSIIKIYGKYMNDVIETTNVSQLLDFLLKLKIN